MSLNRIQIVLFLVVSAGLAAQDASAYYAPEMGQFISRDPIGYDGNDINLFRITFSNPILYSDPMGHTGYCTTVVDIRGKVTAVGKPTVFPLGHSENPSVIQAKNNLEKSFKIGQNYNNIIERTFPKNPKPCPEGKVYKPLTWQNDNIINFAPISSQDKKSFSQCEEIKAGIVTISVCVTVTIEGSIETKMTCYVCQCPDS